MTPLRRTRLGYRLLAHTSEVGVRAWGSDLPTALAEAAKGMFSVMVDLRSVRGSQAVDVWIEASDPTSLSVEWLSELLFRADTAGMVLRCFDIGPLRQEETTLALQATCLGEPFDPERHIEKLHVKAVAYSDAEVVQTNSGWSVRVVLDV